MPVARSVWGATLLVIIAYASAHTEGAALGHIYALALNSSTDTPQFVDVDLTSWETAAAPLPAGPPIHLIGQAACYDNGTFWTSYISGTNFDLGSVRKDRIFGLWMQYA